MVEQVSGGHALVSCILILTVIIPIMKGKWGQNTSEELLRVHTVCV